MKQRWNLWSSLVLVLILFAIAAATGIVLYTDPYVVFVIFLFMLLWPELTYQEKIRRQNKLKRQRAKTKSIW